MILKGLTLGMFMANCYVVASETTKEALVIDPGDEVHHILDAIKELGVTVTLIVATHGHIDHVGGIKKLVEATGAPFAIHAEDAKGLAQRGREMGSWLGASFEAPPPPDRLLQEGDVLEVGDLKFTVLHTPGHSLGSICLYGQGVLFSGDTLFNYSIGRTDLPGGSYAQIMNSIHNKLMTLPGETVVLSGHGDQSTIAEERRHNPFLGG
ncbi:MAG: MBL fold metallo-hydrolase [Chloroflexi bacterium]|nr:MBL fold metallo-hydrolase [Chloroflexota bacterium]